MKEDGKETMKYRPKIRYWLPSGAVEEEDLRKEIRALYDRGFGGIEMVSLDRLAPEVSVSEDGWGRKRWNHMMQVAAEETQKLGMSLDIANGPGWPISSPEIKSIEDPAVLCELTYGVSEAKAGAHYDGALPAPRMVRKEGSPKLIAALGYLEIAPGVLKGDSYLDLMPYVTETTFKRKTKINVGKGNAEEIWEEKNLVGTEGISGFDKTGREMGQVAENRWYLEVTLPEIGKGAKKRIEETEHKEKGVTEEETLSGIQEEREAAWKIFAFYSQPAAQKINSNQCYVVDHLSKEGADASRKYWDKFLGENGGTESFSSLESFFCDSLEYQVALDWTPKMPEEFEKRRGYSLLPYLPFIGLTNLFPSCDVPGYGTEDGNRLGELVNHDYLETLTQCYCENHLAVLEEMAHKYGKNIRYQVAYNKPFEGERCGLYVGIPENEALGRPCVDYQKLMAAAAHLGEKERYSFECAAEFGHSYGQDYEDLFWWVKRSLMAGMNAQVLHGASYSGAYKGDVSENGYVPGTHWPGYEGFDMMVSNYWNRTLSIEDAKGCMDTIMRLNRIFRQEAVVDCAVLRTSYSNDGLGGEFCLYQDEGRLSNAGYSYEFLSEALLELWLDKIKKENIWRTYYKCVIIPQQKQMSTSLLRIVKQLSEVGIPIIWAGEQPQSAYFYKEWDSPEKKTEWKRALEAAWQAPGSLHTDSLEDVPQVLKEKDILPEVLLDGGMDIMTATRRETGSRKRELLSCDHQPEAGMMKGNKYYAVYAYNRVQYTPETPNPHASACCTPFKQGTVKEDYERPGLVSRREITVGVKGQGTVYRYDPWNDKEEKEDFSYDAEKGYMKGCIYLEEDEMALFKLVSDPNTVCEEKGAEDSKVEKRQIMLGKTEEKETEIDKEEIATKDFSEKREQGKMDRQQRECASSITFQQLTFEPFAPDTQEERSFLRSSFHQEEAFTLASLFGMSNPCNESNADVLPQKASCKEQNQDPQASQTEKELETGSPVPLSPWRKLHPSLEHFAGRGIYTGVLTLNEPKKAGRYILELGAVSDTFRVWLNGKQADFPDQVMKQVDITELLQEGRNEIKVMVTGNLYNKVYPNHPNKAVHDRPYRMRDYGIWETEGKKVRLVREGK